MEQIKTNIIQTVRWKFGYPGFMITDTSFYRNPNYHDSGDLPDTLDYDRLEKLTRALYETFRLV